jgi:hypothetical protein
LSWIIRQNGDWMNNQWYKFKRSYLSTMLLIKLCSIITTIKSMLFKK